MGQQELLNAAISSSEGGADPYVFLRELVDHGDSFIDADDRAWAFGHDLVSSMLRSPVMAKRAPAQGCRRARYGDREPPSRRCRDPQRSRHPVHVA